MLIAMLQGRADPTLDGVADYTRLLAAALDDAGVDVVPVAVPGSPGSVDRKSVV